MARCSRFRKPIALLAVGIVAGFAAGPAFAASDPLDPVSAIDPNAASPLRQVTIATGDPAATSRFFVDAMSMTAGKARRLPPPVAAHLGIAGPATTVSFTRPGLDGAASIRTVVVPASTEMLRPKHDALAIGGLAMGMPVNGQAAREAVVTRTGFRSAVGVTSMTLPRPGGEPYTVEEIHYQAPDGVLVLGIDRGAMKPVGTIDTSHGIGGPAYSSLVVGDLAGAGRFMQSVLGYEMRRDAVFTSAGSKGGLGLPDGTRFAFQQWFAPGTSTGYVILMKMIDRPVEPVSASRAIKRGIVMWSFDVADLAAAEARARASGARIVARPARGDASLVIAMPDGFLVQLLQRKGTGR